jgi:hypothetical protein
MPISRLTRKTASLCMACLASEYADLETHKCVTRLQGDLALERRPESVATTAG